MDQATPHTHAEPSDEQAGLTLPIVALVVSILGLCVFVIGPIAGIILGVFALLGARGKLNASPAIGMSIASIAVSALGLLVATPLVIGILLPALNAARDAAMQVQAQVQVRSIVSAIDQYAHGGQRVTWPTPDTWEQQLTSSGLLTTDDFVSPYAEPGQVSYFYVPMDIRNTVQTTGPRISVYENPDLNPEGGIVGYLTGGAEFIAEPTTLVSSTPSSHQTGRRTHRTAPRPSSATAGVANQPTQGSDRAGHRDSSSDRRHQPGTTPGSIRGIAFGSSRSRAFPQAA